jgi:hypothetical protein
MNQNRERTMVVIVKTVNKLHKDCSPTAIGLQSDRRKTALS